MLGKKQTANRTSIIIKGTGLGPNNTKERRHNQNWALSVFSNFSNNKKLFFFIFHKVDNLFLHQFYLKSPLPVKLT